MPITSKIEDTKQLGYDLVEAQGTIKLGLDIEYYDASLAENFKPDEYEPEYLSVNSEGANPKNDGDEGDAISPIDEEGEITTGKKVKIVVETDSFTFNKNNPVHVYLSKVAYKEEMGKNVPFIVEDYALDTVMEGRVNIDVEAEAVGGEKRKLTPVFTFIGKPAITLG